MEKQHRRSMAIGVCLGVTFFLCGCAGEPGPEPPILVRLMADLSGPTRAVGEAYHAGRVDHIKDLNAGGGILGRLLEFEEADTQYDPLQALQKYRWWKGHTSWKDVVTVFGYGSSEAVALNGLVKESEIPFFSKSAAGSLDSPVAITRVVTLEDGSLITVNNVGAPYHFSVTLDYSAAMRAALDFVAANGGKKIAFFYCAARTTCEMYCENPYCGEPIKVGKPYARGQLLLEVADDLVIPLDATENEVVGAIQDYRFSEKGIDWIWLGTPLTTSAAIIKAMRNENVRFMANLWAMNEELAAATAGAANGKVYGIVAAAPYGDMLGSTVMSDVVMAHDASRPAGSFENVFYVMGYATIAVWSIAVERLIAAGEPVTREKIKMALESMKDVNTGGLLDPITYTKEDHRPAMSAKVFKIDVDGKFRYATDVKVERKKLWLGW